MSPFSSSHHVDFKVDEHLLVFFSSLCSAVVKSNTIKHRELSLNLRIYVFSLLFDLCHLNQAAVVLIFD